MASQTRPFLTTGAALASAAAVVMATPAIAPNISGSALSISTSGVNLATFADILTIPSGEWISSFFQGYGGIVGPSNPLPLEPWASGCDGGCFIAGPSGVAYLALDALINGNGEGWENNEDWGVGAVNYFFEGGTPGAGVEYLLQESIGEANPVIGVLITLLWTGPQLVTVVYDNALQLLGDAALNLPVIGEYIFGVINSYLGPASQYVPFQSYFPGLSGILNYAIDVLSGNAPVVEPAASSAAAVSALAEATTPASAVPAGSAAPAADSADAVTAVAGEGTQTAAAATEAADSADAPAETPAAAPTEAAAAAPTEAPAAAPTEAPAAEPTEAAVGTASDAVAETASEAASAADAAPAETPVKTRKRPVRDAVEKVSTAIGSALKGTKAGAQSGSAAGAQSGSAADATASAGEAANG